MPLRTGTPMPELGGATDWITHAVSREELIGSPTLIHFWAVSCYICHENMPTLRQWKEEYEPKGLKIIAVHMPRQESDLDLDRVRADAADMGLTEPCAIDNEHAVANGFENQYVPAYFLFDREGSLRSRSAGNAGLGILKGALERQFLEQPVG